MMFKYKQINFVNYNKRFMFLVFSLFSIVQFKNEACTSSQLLANT